MKIPSSCDTWKLLMQSSVDAHANHIVEMIESEDCIGNSVCEDFFVDLAATSHSNPTEAKQVALDIISSNYPDKYAFQGNDVADSSFRTLVHVSRPSSLEWHTSKEFIVDQGETANDLAQMDEAKLTMLLADWNGPITVKKELAATWATDGKAINVDTVTGDELYNRLGLDWATKEACCVVFVYGRTELADDLRVPRAFDGMAWARFSLVPDCNARYGRTTPNTGNRASGLPEAIHAGAAVKVLTKLPKRLER